jgi:hypothetical protein
MAKRSVTETLIKAMEEADTAQECIVVMTTSEGDMIWLASNDAISVKIGLLESAKCWIVSEMKKL